jgi:hypothetical protein
MKPVAWTWNAALICPDCAAKKPDRDREGNERAPVFAHDASDNPEACDLCGLALEIGLTREGIERLRDMLDDSDARRPLHPAIQWHATLAMSEPEVYEAAEAWKARRAAFLKSQGGGEPI